MVLANLRLVRFLEQIHILSLAVINVLIKMDGPLVEEPFVISVRLVQAVIQLRDTSLLGQSL